MSRRPPSPVGRGAPRLLAVALLAPLWLSAAAGSLADEPPAGTGRAPSTVEQRRLLLRQLEQVHGLSGGQMERLRAIFAASPFIGQGNPAVTEHPATPEACAADPSELAVRFENPEHEEICGGKYMAPLYDPRTEAPGDSRVCIDLFEFPDIPGAYPVVWVRAREAAELCAAVGKRLCDAHEWEGACAGRLEQPDYAFDLARGTDPATAVRRMRARHNRRQAGHEVWSYGPAYRRGVCAASSRKSPGCDGGGWAECGSNTFPAGCFPECRSALGVYDLHGNAAEHMNLPLEESQMASRGSSRRPAGETGRGYGYTEMKGSWFIFDHYRAHEDHCRWRAPFWHGSRVLDERSHHNYHLGFRCCKTISGPPPASRSLASPPADPGGRGSPLRR